MTEKIMVDYDDVDEVLARIHALARRINDDPDDALNYSAEILGIVEGARSPRTGLPTKRKSQAPNTGIKPTREAGSA